MAKKKKHRTKWTQLIVILTISICLSENAWTMGFGPHHNVMGFTLLPASLSTPPLYAQTGDADGRLPARIVAQNDSLRPLAPLYKNESSARGWALFGGLLGGASGAVIGGLVGAAMGSDCNGMYCGLAGAVYGAAIGEPIGLAIGVHLGAGAHGSLGRDVLAAFLWAGIGGGAAALLKSGSFAVVVIPIAQLFGTIHIEFKAAKERHAYSVQK